ncbi:MAG: hypothetical protein ACOC2Z_17995, partial [Coleofasciculus sp.]
MPLNLDDTNGYFYLATSFLAKILSVFPDTIYEQIQSISCYLKWRDYQGQKQVLMVTWTSWNGYD